MVYDIAFDEENRRLYRLAEIEPIGDLSVVEVGYNRVPGGLKQTMRRDVYILHYITGGKGTFMGKPFGKGCAYIVVPGETELLEANEDDPYETYWIMFRGVGARRLLESAHIPHRNCLFDCTDISLFGSILHEAVFGLHPQNKLVEGYMMQAVLYRILALHLGEAKETPDRASDTAIKIKSFIDNHYEENLRIDDIAKKFRYCRSHLYKIFKDAYKTSVMDYLLNVRIEKSKLLLQEKADCTVSEAAYSVGFNDPVYFSRVFHERVGISPSQFKKHSRDRRKSGAFTANE